MKLKCQHVFTAEDGDEMFQVLLEGTRDQDSGPYVLIQRAFLGEDEGEQEPSLCYVETNEERLIGHYPSLEVQLTRNRLALRLPPPVNETIEVEFVTSDASFADLKRVLGIILQHGLGDCGPRNT